jgi:hypothetical protein
MKKNLIISLTSFLICSTIVVAPIFAAGEQSQSQEAQAECETETIVGPYGQTTTRCKIDIKQEQEQKIVYVDQVEEKVHEPVDTALDSKMIVATMSTIASGAGAFIIKIKQKIVK